MWSTSTRSFERGGLSRLAVTSLSNVPFYNDTSVKGLYLFGGNTKRLSNYRLTFLQAVSFRRVTPQP